MKVKKPRMSKKEKSLRQEIGRCAYNIKALEKRITLEGHTKENKEHMQELTNQLGILMQRFNSL